MRQIEFISKQRDKPFFVYVAFTEPHSWIEAPRSEVARFLGEFEEADVGEPNNARYAAMITKMDESLGRGTRRLGPHESERRHAGDLYQ